MLFRQCEHSVKVSVQNFVDSFCRWTELLHDRSRPENANLHSVKLEFRKRSQHGPQGALAQKPQNYIRAFLNLHPLSRVLELGKHPKAGSCAPSLRFRLSLLPIMLSAEGALCDPARFANRFREFRRGC